MSELPDRAEREIIRADLDHDVIVEAAAGTGKTTELVNRMVAVLARGLATVDSLVAVTFTEKAAGELKLRLRAALEQARHASGDGAPRRHLEAALARLEEARVGTIHGFCADLLRERPVEARVDPEFRVLTEAEAERLYDEAFSRWLYENLEDPPEGVRRSLRRVSAARDEGPATRLNRAGWMLAGWRDFPARWRRDGFEREKEIDALAARVHEFADLTRRAASPARDNLYLDTVAARRWSDDVRRAEAIRARDHDGLEGGLVRLAGDGDFRRARRGYGTFFAKEVARSSVVSAHAELVAELQAFARAADADLAAVLQGELLETVERYERQKERAGVLDFVDLLVRARDLIRDEDAVRADFQRRFTHLFVDEFQDTDPLQAEILILLSASDPAVRDWRAVRPSPGKLFVVGDPKQSIYRFRRADVGTYLEAAELLERCGARRVRLTTSFRAVPSIQHMVNASFAGHMTGDRAALQAEYVALAPFRAETPGQPSVVALPVPRPYGRRRAVTKTAIEGSLPDVVAAFVDWLLNRSGWKVSERDRPGVAVNVAPRHVCLLFRRFDSYWAGDVTRSYVRALEARGVPHLLVGGKSFHAREEVETMRAALSAIEWPEDELSVFATLRGSLFAIGDEELLCYRQSCGPFHPFARREVPPELRVVGDALGFLAALHRGRNHRTVAETISLLLEATRAHAGFALRPSGEQALANVLHIAELARAYETSGGLSFRGFVERLLGEAESRQTAEAPILEEGSDGVRLMTTHKAKGLEFPVVVLADVTARPTGQVARFVDPERRLCALRIAGWTPAELLEREEEEERRDAAEAVRVAYVAATRARDLLVVPAVGDQPFESGWVSCLNGAVYPAKDRWQAPAIAPGCPPFGNDATVERPAEIAHEASGVKPGLHEFESTAAPGAEPKSGYGVVWWDPHSLTLDAEPRFGIRRQDLIAKDTPQSIVDADLEAYRRWLASRDAAVERGSRPSLVVRTATQHAAAAAAGELPEVAVAEVARAARRPSGARFGALVHAALASVPLAASEPNVESVVRQQGRILGAADEEIQAAIRAVAAALAHPLLERAAAASRAGACRRETPVTVRLDDGALVEGVVDLAFLENGAWTVVDFKTDHELARGLDAYRRQVALYARAIRAATGQPAGGVLLRV